MAVQREVLPRYGFSGDEAGMEKVREQIGQMFDATIGARMHALERKLHIPKGLSQNVFNLWPTPGAWSSQQDGGNKSLTKVLTKARAEALLMELDAASLEKRLPHSEDPNSSARAALQRFGFEGTREGLNQMRLGRPRTLFYPNKDIQVL